MSDPTPIVTAPALVVAPAAADAPTKSVFASSAPPTTAPFGTPVAKPAPRLPDVHAAVNAQLKLDADRAVAAAAAVRHTHVDRVSAVDVQAAIDANETRFNAIADAARAAAAADALTHIAADKLARANAVRASFGVPAVE